MTKSETRRAAILEALADHVLAHGLSAASLRPLAQAAGVSDRMLLYYFRDKAEVVDAVLAVVAARLTRRLGDSAGPPLPVADLRAKLAAVLLADALWPYMRLWLEIAALAAQGDAALARAGEAIGRGFYAWGLAQIAARTPQQQAIDAAHLLVAIEGMVLLKSIGMGDIARLAV